MKYYTMMLHEDGSYITSKHSDLINTRYGETSIKSVDIISGGLEDFYVLREDGSMIIIESS